MVAAIGVACIPSDTGMKMIVVTTISTKGGVGKTTTAANLGGILADLGLRVLLIDADEQPSLSKYFPVREVAPHGLTQALQAGLFSRTNISSVDLPVPGRLDLVIGDAHDGNLRQWLSPRLDRAFRMRSALRASPLLADYDVILIDTQGAAGEILDTAALAADVLLSPIAPDILSAREFRQGTIQQLEHLEAAGIGLGQIKALIYRKDRSRDARMISDEIRRDFLALRGRVDVLKCVVPYAKAYKEAATLRIPVHWHEPNRSTAAAAGTPSAARVMLELVWELIPNFAGLWPESIRKTLNGVDRAALEQLIEEERS
ncbi:ParA family protein [Burkholderia glumae]|uniref:ParA family protein n=1 Tax=Burkholderia glumae TaxID=337 RepID=UPI0023DE7EE7|nr:ParA family protein [Burkholderia glumae]